MVFTAVEARRVDYDEADGIRYRGGGSTDSASFFDNILRVLPLTKMIAVVVGASPNETFWLEGRSTRYSRH